jgi:hypothetical protein
MAHLRWIPPNERINNQAWVEIDSIMSDPNRGLNGPVHVPDGGYFDPILNRRFDSASEKRTYMREHGLMMHSGSKKQTEGNYGKTYYFIPGMKNTNRYYKNR